MREGDPLEIFTGQGGEIIFKKYSIMAELSEFSQTYADSLYKVSGMHCVIFDSDRVIAYTGPGKKDVVSLSASKEIEDMLASRTSYFKQYSTERAVFPYQHSEMCVIGAVPVIAAGDGIGVVALLGGENDTITDAQKKLLVLTGTFIAAHLEI